jgi:hypothetical protein
MIHHLKMIHKLSAKEAESRTPANQNSKKFQFVHLLDARLKKLAEDNGEEGSDEHAEEDMGENGEGLT